MSETPSSQVPQGFLIDREEDGAIRLVLPLSQDRFLKLFFPLFGLPFTLAGLHEVLTQAAEARSYAFLGFGLIVEWFGWYMLIGKLEMRLGRDTLEWRRLYLRRWGARVLERGQIAGIGTLAGVRSNRRPISWTLHFALTHPPDQPPPKRPKRMQIPGFYSDTAIQWLGTILSTWAQAPFDGKLDRTLSMGD